MEVKFREMNFRLASLTVLVLASVSPLPGSDLSHYREFYLGMPLADAAKQAGTASSEAKLISSRPECIEELDWRTNRFSPATTRPDSVREIRFRFYNGALFGMMVSYDPGQTGGMTDSDMKEALSAIYGPGSTSAPREMVFNAGYDTSVRVIAQWDDPRSLLSLVALSYGRGFGLIVSSASNLTLARRAIAESDRLDQVEAPQRELDERAKQAADTEARDEKSRLLNKPGFRP